MPQSSDASLYRGHGVVLFAELPADDDPSAVTYKFAGNVSALEIATEQQTEKHVENQSGTLSTDDEWVTSRTDKLTMTWEGFSMDIIAAVTSAVANTGTAEDIDFWKKADIDAGVANSTQHEAIMYGLGKDFSKRYVIKGFFLNAANNKLYHLDVPKCRLSTTGLQLISTGVSGIPVAATCFQSTHASQSAKSPINFGEATEKAV